MPLSCSRTFNISHFLVIKSKLLNIANKTPCVYFLVYSQGSDFSLVENRGNCVRLYRNNVTGLPTLGGGKALEKIGGPCEIKEE